MMLVSCGQQARMLALTLCWQQVHGEVLWLPGSVSDACQPEAYPTKQKNYITLVLASLVDNQWLSDRLVVLVAKLC